MKLTPFESEILDSILWQVEGFKIGRVTQRATSRILRATIRRIRPRLIARSEAVNMDSREIDHAIPLQVLCNRVLSTSDLDRSKLETILDEWLVTVELTVSEHREVLQKCGLRVRCRTIGMALIHWCVIGLRASDYLKSLNGLRQNQNDHR